MRNFLWIIAEIGVFLVWKNAERHVGKKNITVFAVSFSLFKYHFTLKYITPTDSYQRHERTIQETGLILKVISI